jgi:hypothetical protein
MEISTADPKLGAVFYTLENEKVRVPRFTREFDCLRCHGAQRSLGVPGHVLRSIGNDASGELDPQTEVSDIDQCTPLSDRWAGFYVTGRHGKQTHRGNLPNPEAFAKAAAEPNAFGNLLALNEFFSVDKYLRPTSDIVALMVLDHQAKMHNYITRLNYETQIMVSMYGHIRYLSNQVNAFLRYLLLTEAVPLQASVEGDPAFVEAFQRIGPFDSKGRSLRSLDLQTRLFKYPCSYLIYADAFDALPPVMRDHLLRRLFDVLTGKDADPQFARISQEDRTAVLEILRETKASLPDYWKGAKNSQVTEGESK